MSPDGPAGALYVGHVMHARLRPRPHRFRYRVFTLLADLDRLAELDRASPLFSVGRFNLVSFQPRDHGWPGANAPLADQARAAFARAGIAVERVWLMAYPRLFGYAFNPISVYYGTDAEGRLVGALAEVRNTFGERHTYPLALGADGARARADKAFHVSPFLPMNLAYRFGLEAPGEEARVSIVESDAQGPILTAVFAGTRRALSSRTLLGTLARTPLMTLKVVAAIHWEALRLLGKGIRVHPHPRKIAGKALGDAQA